MTDESTVLNNLRTAHYGDWGVDLSSQEVHELWADIEAKEIISSCMQILSSQAVHGLWAEIETRDKRVAELEVENKALRKQLWFSVCLKNVIQKETNAIRMSINKANNIASEER